MNLVFAILKILADGAQGNTFYSVLNMISFELISVVAILLASAASQAFATKQIHVINGCPFPVTMNSNGIGGFRLESWQSGDFWTDDNWQVVNFY